MAELEKKILVEVFNGSQPEASCGCSCSGCDSSAGGCGSPIDMEKDINKLSEELKNSFGDKVEVKYIDIDEVGIDQYPNIGRVLGMGYPYPIISLNGEPKFAGSLMPPQIRHSINELLAE